VEKSVEDALYLCASMAKRHYEHRVEKTRNKHSRAVFREDTIVIRLARNLTKKQQKDHVKNLLDRMVKQLLKEEKHRIHINPFEELFGGKDRSTITLANGNTYEISLRAGKKLSAARTEKGWDVQVSPRTRRTSLHRFLWNLIADAEYDQFVEFVESINKQTLNVRIQKVKLRFASSQWGSCSSKGIVMLNTALLFVPPELLHYVTIHELAHRKHSNHSSTYWRIVEDVLPEYRRLREHLHKFRLPAL